MPGDRVTVRLTGPQAARLDVLRAARGLSRPALLRVLLDEASEAPRDATAPTFDEMLRLLGDQARAGRVAATIAAARLLADRERQGEPEAAAQRRRRDELAARRRARRASS